MKVSKDIQNKMHRYAKLTHTAKLLSREIDQYFEEHGYDIDLLREYKGDSGTSLDELDYGLDVTDQFVSDMESGYYEDCRL